jgi:hypothetical protein
VCTLPERGLPLFCSSSETALSATATDFMNPPAALPGGSSISKEDARADAAVGRKDCLRNGGHHCWSR